MSSSKDPKVNVLIQISNALSSSLDMEKTLSSILKILSESLNMERGTITLVDPKTNELHIEVAQGLSAEEKERGRYKIGEGITGKVVETGQPMIVKDIGSNPLFLNKTKARDLETRKFAFLCIPIKVGNKTIGALSVDHLFKGDISYEEDIKLLTIIAAIVGQTVRLRELAEKEKQAVITENIQLKKQLQKRHRFDNIIYSSMRMEQILDSAMQVADSMATVLITGESGTGKELVASAIHYASPRKNGPFIKIACAAIPETLLESELFGYERGAFTGALERKIGKFEAAEKGTIFLDEIGDLSLSTQVKLLRVIQEREFERLGGNHPIKCDIRIICATHRDLKELVRQGKFREDLFYRINVFQIQLPPLRERKEDIPVLVDHFIKKYAKNTKGKVKGITKAALDILMDYFWPGNVRELEHVIERALIVCRKDLITPSDLSMAGPVGADDLSVAGLTLPELVDSIEKQKISEALAKYGTQRKAAKALGLTERMLGYKIHKYGIKT